MTNDQLFTKLQDFIITFVQAEIAASEKRQTELLIKRMDDGFNGIAEAIMKINDLHENHEHRIVDLEIWRQKQRRAT